MRRPTSRAKVLVAAASLIAAAIATPAWASSLWGANWGGYLGGYQLSIWPIDSHSGSASEQLRIPGDLSRAGVLDFASDPARNPSIVWSLHNTQQHGYELLSFNPYRQQLLSNVSLDDSLEIRGLAIDPTTGLMYGTSTTALYQIHPLNGQADLIGATDDEAAWALGFDLQGRLFGVGFVERQLVSIDKSTGKTTIIGEMDAWPADIAVHPEDGVMYGLGHSGTPGYTYGLYEIDLATGIASQLGPSGTRPAGLAFTIIPEPSSLVLSLLAMASMVYYCSTRSRFPYL